MSLKEFALGIKDSLGRHRTTDMAATVTYYGFLALFPFLLLVVGLASVVISPQQAEQLVRQLSQMAPGAVTQVVGDRIRQLGQQQNVSLVGFGALGALWAAAGAVSAASRALNATYEVKESRPFWKTQGLAILMTVFAGVLALVAGLVAIAAPTLAGAVGGPMATAVVWLRLPVAGLLMMFLWAVVYYVLPDVEQDFKFITPGSVTGVVIWVIATWGFSVYVGHFASYDRTYGSIAGIIVLLVWMWLSSLVLLVGAETNALIEHRSPEGKRKGAKSLADRGTGPADGSAPSLASVSPERFPAHPAPRRIGMAAAAFALGVFLGRRGAGA